jgi:hypothetical protein
VTMLRAIMSFAEGAETPKPIRQTTTAAVRPTKANIPTARPVTAHACFVMTSPPRGNRTKLVGALFGAVLSTSGDGSSGPEAAQREPNSRCDDSGFASALHVRGSAGVSHRWGRPARVKHPPSRSRRSASHDVGPAPDHGHHGIPGAL